MYKQETDEAKLLIRKLQFGSARHHRIFFLFSAALWSSIALLALPRITLAQSTLIDDAHTNTAPKFVDSNYGTNPNLFVSSTGNVYVKFKVSSTLPAGTPGSAIERATLKLYLANVTTSGKLDVYVVTGPWDEATITARNAPLLGNLIATSAEIGLDKRNEFLSIDITPTVQQWLGDDGQGTNGIPNYGIAIVVHPPDTSSSEAANITFDSKENSQTSHEPQLELFVQSSSVGLQSVAHDLSLKGDGTAALPLGVATGGINNTHLANDAVSSEKIADNAVATSELSDGSVTSPKVKAPLSLTSADANFTFSAANTGPGAAITASGPINTTMQYNIGGTRVLSTPGNANLIAGQDAGTSLIAPGAENSFFGRGAGKMSITAQFNSFFGNSSGQENTTGSRNVFAGWGAGYQNTTGGSNSFGGVFAGRSNTTGEFNTHFGYHAGSGYQIGSWNTFIGGESGTPVSELREGNNNTALGYRAWVDNGLSFATAIGSGAVVSTSNTVVLGRSADKVHIPGSLNVEGTFGANVLDAVMQINIGGQRILSTPGTDNLFAGVDVGTNNTTGSANAFFGSRSGAHNTIGEANAFVGVEAGTNNTSGGGNAFIGYQAGFNNTTGYENTFVGAPAGAQNTTGFYNTFVGASAGLGNKTGSYNTFIGRGAGFETGSISLSLPQQATFNTFAGFGSGTLNTTGFNNSFFGGSAGSRNTTGNNNTIIGAGANFGIGFNNLSYATAIGSDAIVSTSNTVVLGRSADTVQVPGALNVTGTLVADTLNAATQYNIGGTRMLSNTGAYNLFAGEHAGEVSIGAQANSFFGYSAGAQNINNFNSFFGSYAGAQNTLGFANAFFGANAGFWNVSGTGNTFVGINSGENNGNGGSNTIIGAYAGFNIINNTGELNTLIGYRTHAIGPLTNATAIGGRAQVTQSNSLVLGGITGVGGGTDTNVGIGTTAPKTKLHLKSGKIYVEANGQGVVLKSPAGNCFELTITDAGVLTTAAIVCP